MAVNKTTAEKPGLTGREAKRREVIQAAADVFYRHGYSAGTTAEVAELVGLSQPAIYHYVGSKADLLHEVTALITQDAAVVLARAKDSSDDPVEQLRALITEFTPFALQKTFQVYWKENNSFPDATRHTVNQAQARFLDDVASIVEGVQRAGHLPEGWPSRSLASAILGMISWSHQWYRPARDGSIEDIAAMFTALVLPSVVRS